MRYSSRYAFRTASRPGSGWLYDRAWCPSRAQRHRRRASHSRQTRAVSARIQSATESSVAATLRSWRISSCPSIATVSNPYNACRCMALVIHRRHGRPGNRPGWRSAGHGRAGKAAPGSKVERVGLFQGRILRRQIERRNRVGMQHVKVDGRIAALREKAADAACNQRTNDPANHSGRPVLVEQPALVGRSAVLFGYNLRRSICPRKTHR